MTVSNAVLLEKIDSMRTEVSRLADEMARMNGTVRSLCEWRAAVEEREKSATTHPQAVSLVDLFSKRLLLAVAIGAALAGAGGGALLSRIVELLK